MLYQCKKNLTV